MRIFSDGQDRTRVFGEAYTKYAATKNPQRTKSSKKRPFMGRHYLATILANHMVSGE